MTTDRYQRAPFFRPGEIPRLLAMVGMLAVMAMLIFQARDPSLWRWLTHENAEQDAAEDIAPAKKPARAVKTAENKAVKKAEPELSVSSSPSPAVEPEKGASPPAETQPAETKPAETKPAEAQTAETKPAESNAIESKPVDPAPPPAAPPAKEPEVLAGTDLDPDEQDEFQTDVLTIKDGSLEIQGGDMKAYLRLMRWVELQPLEALRARAKKADLFREYAQKNSAERHRGDLVRLNLTVRMINVLPVSHIEHLAAMGLDHIYEVWGTTDQSQNFFWCCLTPHLPAGMKTGSQDERAKFYGYFLKVQGYSNKDSKAESKWPAPLLIGRLDWQPRKVAVVAPESGWSEYLIGGAVLGLALCGWLLYRVLNRDRASHISGSLPTPAASAAGFAQFLEQGPAPDHSADSYGAYDQPANGHSTNQTGLPYSDPIEP